MGSGVTAASHPRCCSPLRQQRSCLHRMGQRELRRRSRSVPSRQHGLSSPPAPPPSHACLARAPAHRAARRNAGDRRANAQQPKLFVGMILILIFAEALALYGLIGEWLPGSLPAPHRRLQPAPARVLGAASTGARLPARLAGAGRACTTPPRLCRLLQWASFCRPRQALQQRKQPSHGQPAGRLAAACSTSVVDAAAASQHAAASRGDCGRARHHACQHSRVLVGHSGRVLLAEASGSAACGGGKALID